MVALGKQQLRQPQAHALQFWRFGAHRRMETGRGGTGRANAPIHFDDTQAAAAMWRQTLMMAEVRHVGAGFFAGVHQCVVAVAGDGLPVDRERDISHGSGHLMMSVSGDCTVGVSKRSG